MNANPPVNERYFRVAVTRKLRGHSVPKHEEYEDGLSPEALGRYRLGFYGALRDAAAREEMYRRSDDKRQDHGNHNSTDHGDRERLQHLRPGAYGKR